MKISLGLDVGGTKILACAVTAEGELVAETRVDSPRSPEVLLEALMDAADAILELVGPDRDHVVGVGVGVPSLVGSDGSLFSSPNLPALEGLPVYRAFSERLNLKYGVTSPHRPWTLVLDNDGTCAAAGELAFGAAKNYQDAIVLTLGTGIGSGIIVAGQILRGARGFAGEPGHMVIDPAGPPCQCGRTGCFEKLASGSALTRLARTAAARGEATRILELADGDAEAVRGEYVLKAAREGDPDAFKIYRELATSLAAGIANLVEILDPAVVIIGGGLADAGTILLDATVEAFAASGDRRGIGPTAVPIKLAELGYRAGAFGAAAQALGIVH